jgi:hypothetical protein
MAKFAATDYSVLVGGVNLSTNLNSVELTLEADDLETTAFGNDFRTKIAGLKSGSVTLNFMQDFGAASVDATLFPLFGTQATVVIKPTSGSVSATNPTYSFLANVVQYSPFNSSVGDIATLSVSWPTAGSVVRGTSA